jgi:hypothetical protein
MTSFLDSRRLTYASLSADAMEQGQITRVDYYAYAEFDGTPAAAEVFINGVEGQRLHLPVDSAIIGRAILAAWNVTDNSAATAAGSLIDFMISNDSGTVAFTPTNLSGSDGNPIIARTGGVGTLTVGADDTNDALTVLFTGAASKNYYVRGHIDFQMISLNSRPNVNYDLIAG